MIRRLLVANRGEIARRVLRTCRYAGIETVAVFADPDERAAHVAEADLAVRLPGAAPSETYLRGDLLVAAAGRTGADAVHPGYGFLSENAGFGRSVIEAGLTWVGPPPEAMEAMGSKIEAKQLMAAAGVPVLPEIAPDRATEADLPLLVKASAGGGGRGMRRVSCPAGAGGTAAARAVAEAVEAARREARSAFGDPAVFCEPLLEGARHVEVQVLADAHGTVWTLGERECSIQRRHQKVLEEAPSPAVDDELRAALCEAAAGAARAIGYVGAGTVEFLLAGDGRFFFLEVNTRLQVEHPVTECVYGVDLVRLQLEVAEGVPLPAAAPRPRGHAIEVRLYAEDPARDWRPSTGTLHTLQVPAVDAEFAVPPGYGLRLDSGVVDGDEVGAHYDPLLAKVIAWAPGRAAAARRLAPAQRRAPLPWLTTNRDLLVRVLGEPGFLAGDTDTGYLERVGLDTLAAPLAGPRAVELSALAAALSDAAANRERAPVLGELPSGWRNVPARPQRKVFEGPYGVVQIDYRLSRAGLVAEITMPDGSGRPGPAGDAVRLVAVTADEVVLDAEGVRHRLRVRAVGGWRHIDSALGPVSLRPVPRFADPGEQVAPGSLLAPMPGGVVRVETRRGETVRAGQTLVVLEAMKMEHRIVAPAGGVVTELRVEAGRQVEAGAVLAVIEEETAP